MTSQERDLALMWLHLVMLEGGVQINSEKVPVEEVQKAVESIKPEDPPLIIETTAVPPPMAVDQADGVAEEICGAE